jgi:hypothetical protein
MLTLYLHSTPSRKVVRAPRSGVLTLPFFVSAALAEQISLGSSSARMAVVVVRTRLAWGLDDTALLRSIVQGTLSPSCCADAVNS